VGSVRGKSLRHQYGAHSMHAQHDSRKTTKAGREANSARFERQVDPEGSLLRQSASIVLLTLSAPTCSGWRTGP
jgi:hypothetical protein